MSTTPTYRSHCNGDIGDWLFLCITAIDQVNVFAATPTIDIGNKLASGRQSHNTEARWWNLLLGMFGEQHGNVGDWQSFVVLGCLDALLKDVGPLIVRTTVGQLHLRALTRDNVLELDTKVLVMLECKLVEWKVVRHLFELPIRQARARTHTHTSHISHIIRYTISTYNTLANIHLDPHTQLPRTFAPHTNAS
jgi:hypothetical protein